MLEPILKIHSGAAAPTFGLRGFVSDSNYLDIPRPPTCPSPAKVWPSARKRFLGLVLAKRSGQTLLELIIAIGVIITSTLAATSLIITTISAGRVGQNRVEAANFAREGIEIIRSVRDTNYLRRDQNIQECNLNLPADLINCPAGGGLAPVEWDDVAGLAAGDGYKPLDCSTSAGPTNYVVNRNATGAFLLQGNGLLPCTQDPIGGNLVIRDIFRTVGGITHRFFSQNCPAGFTCQPTRYSRIIAITKFSGVPAPGVDPGEEVAALAPGVRIEYLDVVSTVTWSDRTGPKTLAARERLYNWR